MPACCSPAENPNRWSGRRAQARDLGLADVTLFAGERPASDIPAYLLASDVLVSPRSKGTNTPLEDLSVPAIRQADRRDRLLTHTQVLSDDTAILTGVSSAEFAEGILRALENPLLAQAIGRRARELAETKYSYDAYLERTRRACGALHRGRALTASRPAPARA